MTSSLPGSVLRTHVESLGKPRDVNNRQQSFSKPCLVNLVSPSIDFARGSESCAYSINSHDSHETDSVVLFVLIIGSGFLCVF